jgi:antagonist of KipI
VSNLSTPAADGVPARSLTVLRPGMLTTVQDLGRWGYQGIGIPVAGPMDPYSHRLANRLVGNVETAAALEVTLLGPELEAHGGVVTCAVAGARFELTVDGHPVPMDNPFNVPPGARIRFVRRRSGARAALAVAGGFDVEAAYGSRASSLISRIGPFGGAALRAGQVLPVGGSPAGRVARTGRGLTLPDGGARLRVLLGPHADMFTPAALELLAAGRFVVSSRSNRMGYRLEGPVLEHLGAADILSDATPIGSIQVPASGQPILLMADRQTTGGYPRIGTVITADLPLAGQLAPGDWMEFEPVSRMQALEALKRQQARLEGRG